MTIEKLALSYLFSIFPGNCIRNFQELKEMGGGKGTLSGGKVK